MTKPTAHSTAANLFKQRLSDYKQLLDADIADYSKHVRTSTLQQYGVNSRLEIDAFLDILSRGGKRLRGALTMLAYSMSGGTDRQMILQAARAVEMMHAYILMIDDIQDRSPTRRGGPTAHMSLADYHRQNELAGDSSHFGVAIALNAAVAGAHAAQIIIADLNADPALRLSAISIINRTMIITAHGQTSDIMNEVVAEVSTDDIIRVLHWKTAEYTFLNPLCIGMVLAGADCQATDAIRGYAVSAGMAFQITDDVLGIFGSEFESGKSPMDDIREGKRTVLTVYALEHANDADKDFLLQMLGNGGLTPAQFERCKTILVTSGALDHARTQATHHVQQALAALDAESRRWPKADVEFLRQLVSYLLTRTS